MTFDFDDLNEMVAKISGARTLKIDDPAAQLYEMGLDSLDLSVLYVELEKKFGFNLRDTDLQFLDTAESIIKFVNGKRGE